MSEKLGNNVVDKSLEIDKDGNFVRTNSAFRETVSKEHPIYKPEKDRYHLYVALICPWAHRTLIVRELKGLQDVISVSIVHYHLERSTGWKFSTKEGATVDHINGFEYLKQVYLLSNPNYIGKITVPVLFDKKTKTIVNNESSEIIVMLNSAFNEFSKTKEQAELDLYPVELKDDIDKINDLVYNTVNNGVYKCGFAETQESYENNYYKLFESLDYLESLLSKQRYLVGKKLTLADLRLFVTLIRFDIAYYGFFKCNRNLIKEFPALSNYLKELYQIPEFKKTVDFHHIKNGYFLCVNQQKSAIVPLGPNLDYLNQPHNRSNL
ncbi:hypothetical protein DICPUDRAFT_38429 [Dictyostelium purpureum]|uniref:GST C-terminal domain-containing protein n=1 Tax=Dictyostelium purpureum TaxID=5786 RepID=F0ZUE8_DICPU|nr:uncharacterized protein DICPUDRAFT_38429 [Dictyostelium purpureum]EGC32428.1 hypothetical protein DICPUDRAFT_38429 [Dictyostelium purpureum]|eukprot:XP_003291040.1 hypothetical protein DICPUDRAFT_38429 [Dictyostelium purpureum]